MLARVGIEPPEDIRGGIFLEFDGGYQTQQVIPVLSNDCLVDGFVRFNGAGITSLIFRFEDIEGLFADALDAQGEGKPQHMREAKNHLGVIGSGLCPQAQQIDHPADVGLHG